jgi:hypothetical protein
MTAEPRDPFSASQSGVYRAPAGTAALRKAAVRKGLAWYGIDLAATGDKAGFLSACASALGFPESFGHNWDALADSLQDFSWRPAPGYVLHLTRAAPLIEAASSEWTAALEVLDVAATYWKERGKVFIVMVEGVNELPALSP